MMRKGVGGKLGGGKTDYNLSPLEVKGLSSYPSLGRKATHSWALSSTHGWVIFATHG